jgi:hypothetical protein
VHRTLLEPREGIHDLGAVVGLTVVPADLDVPAPDPDAVADAGQLTLAVPRVGDERGEAVRADVVRDVVPEGLQTS